MAHTGIFATSDEILVKAGANYNTAITEARINALCLQAEAFINATTRYNWSDAYSGLNADVQGLLAEAESNLVAVYIISYDMSGYTSRFDAETMMNVLYERFQQCISMLKEQITKDFMEGA